MARLFDGVDDRILTSTLPSTATDNLTMGGWFYFDSLATDTEVTLYNGDSGANGYGMGLQAGTSNLQLLLGGIVWAIGGAISAGAWMHLVLRRSSTTWQIYKDGAALGSTTTTNPVAPSGVGFYIGDSLQRDSANLPKRAAEVFFFERALDVSEIAVLADGFSPSFLQPTNRKLYWQLIGRSSPEINMWSTNTGTVTGAVQAEHPRIIYPYKRKTYFLPQSLYIPVVNHKIFTTKVIQGVY